MTLNKLRKKLSEVSDNINDIVTNKIKDCDSLWEAKCLAQELFWTYRSPLYHINDVCSWSDITWNGLEIKGDRVVVQNIDGVSVHKFTNASLRGYGKNASVRKEYKSTFKVKRDINIFLDDTGTKTGAAGRCRYFVEQQDAPCYLVKFNEDYENAEQDFFKESGMTHLKKVSELPKPPRFARKSTAGSGVRKDKVFKYSSNGYSKSSYWDSTEIDFDAGGVYVEVNRYNCVNKSAVKYGEVDGSLLKSLLNKLASLVGEDDVPEIYGVKTAIVDRYKKNESWVSLFDYITQKIDSNAEKFSTIFIKKNDLELLSDWDSRWFWSVASEFNLGDEGINFQK